MLVSWSLHVTAVFTTVIGICNDGPDRLYTPTKQPGASLYRVAPWPSDE